MSEDNDSGGKNDQPIEDTKTTGNVVKLEEEKKKRKAKGFDDYGGLPQWKKSMQWGQQLLRGTKSNVALILLNDDRIKGRIFWNVLSERIETSASLPWKPDKGHHDDNDELNLRSWLADYFVSDYRMSEPGAQATHEAMEQAAKTQQRNLLIEWLKGLQWDGVPRIDAMMTNIFGLEPSDYHAAVARVMTIGAVKRALQPGCKMDYMPIFQGLQGLWKSTLLSILYGEWFAEKASPSFEGANVIMEMTGLWVMEIPELNAFSKSDVNAIKSFLSRRMDLYRPPYGRSVIHAPRRCLFIGTTNDDSYLRDDTGNRRFLPVDIKDHRANLDFVQQNREQIFAEAMRRQGDSIVLNEKEHEKALEMQQNAYVEDPWTEDITNWLHHQAKTSVTPREIMSDILKIEPGRKQKADLMRIGKIMKQLGWIRSQMRIGNDRYWVYRMPDKKP